jgi:hypothetical protein
VRDRDQPADRSRGAAAVDLPDASLSTVVSIPARAFI